MRRLLVVMVALAALAAPAAGVATNPPGTGQPSQTCLSGAAPSEPGNAASARGSAFNENGGIESASTGADLHPGEQVCFSGETEKERSVITSPLDTIERPEKDIVAHYIH